MRGSNAGYHTHAHTHTHTHTHTQIFTITQQNTHKNEVERVGLRRRITHAHTHTHTHTQKYSQKLTKMKSSVWGSNAGTSCIDTVRTRASACACKCPLKVRAIENKFSQVSSLLEEALI